jgi:hypothetical protein
MPARAIPLASSAPAPDRLGRRVRLGIAGHPVLAVVVLTYALAWAVLVPMTLESHGWFPVAVPVPAALAVSWGPAIAALAVAATFFTAGRPFYEQVGFPMFAAWTVTLTILLTWIYNSTPGSLLLSVLFHAGQFAWQQLLAAPEVAPFFISVALLWAVAFCVIARNGPGDLARRPREIAHAWLGA